MSNNHCKDCCCAQSWKALGITEYTGMSIPEHIERLTAEVEKLRRALQGIRNGACDDDDKDALHYSEIRQIAHHALEGLRNE